MINFEMLVSEYKDCYSTVTEHTPRVRGPGYYLIPKYDVLRQEPFIDVGLTRGSLAVFEGGLIRLKYLAQDLPYKVGQEDLNILNRFGLNIHSTRYIDSSDFSLPDPLVQQEEIFKKGKKPAFKKAHISNGAIFVINKGMAYLGTTRGHGWEGQIEWENGEVGGVGGWTTTVPDRPKRAAARKLLGEVKDLLPAFGFMYDERLKYLRSEGLREGDYKLRWNQRELQVRHVMELLDDAPEAQFLFERAMVVLGQEDKITQVIESTKLTPARVRCDVSDLLAFDIFRTMHRSHAPKSLIDRYTRFNESHTHPHLIVKDKENDAL
jgi:hypothetical protein